MSDHVCETDKGFCPTCGKANLSVLQSVGLSQTATPTRKRTQGKQRNPREVNKNHWERGIPTDEKGLPFLDENLQPVRNKRFAERRGSGCWDYPGRQVSRG